jgi:hypothetical protein
VLGAPFALLLVQEKAMARNADESLPDPKPWENARRRPADRPRHEHDEPEDPRDPAEASAAIEAESWGEVVEVARDEGSVDGDLNGAPELEALEQTEGWEGADVLEAIGANEQEIPVTTPVPEALLADAIADRRSVLCDRLDEARELGLGSIVEAALASSAPASGSQRDVDDVEELREQLAVLDEALSQLESRSA